MSTASQPPEPPDREINTGGGAFINGPVTNQGGTNNFGQVNYYNQPPKSRPEEKLPVFEMPHNQNPNFVGRVQELAEMHTALQNGGSVALTALHGSGGIGKTSLAIEYAFRHRGEYPLVWWVSSENELNLQTSLAELSRRLELAALDTPTAEAIAAVLNWLATTPTRWLLIFDNADTPAQTRPYLPKGGGHCLITSRWQDWSQLTDTAIKVKLMTEGEAVELLTRRSDDKDEAAAKELAKLLGYLPLALEQAGAYCRETSKKLSAYGKLFEDKRRALLDKNAPVSHEQTVAATFGLALQQIEQIKEVGPKAADLLRLLAYVAPEPLAVEVLAEHADQLPEPLATVCADELERDEVLAVLANYSLIERADDQITVHRLMQAVVADKVAASGPEAATDWAKAALQLINEAFPDDIDTDIAAWPVCATLLPHAQAVCRQAWKLTDRTQPLSRLLNQIGLYLQKQASFEEAKTYYEQAIANDEATLGLNDLETASSIGNLGNVLRELGQLQEAKQCFERAIKINETAYGPSHPDVAAYFINLGNVLQDLEQFAEARQCYEQAVKIDEAIYGPNHPYLAIVVNNLGSVLQKLGLLEEAKQCFERAVKIDEAAYGSHHPDVAARISNLGGVLKELGHLQEAKQCYERAITIDEATYGPNHPNVAVFVSNLSSVLKDLGHLKEAKQCLERAIKIDEAIYGLHHPKVAIRLSNLGSVLKDLGHLKEAKQCFERAVRIDEATYGPHHPNLAIRLNNLGALLYEQRDYEGAKTYMVLAYATCRQYWGEEHPYTVDSRVWLEDILEAIAAQDSAERE